MEIDNEKINRLLDFMVYYAYVYTLFVLLALIVIAVVLIGIVLNLRRTRKEKLQARAMDVTEPLKGARRGIKR